MKKPLISIIIPVYNAEKYLKQCLTALHKQTYTNIEIICVNDGSKDNSLQILQDFAKKDTRIKIFSQPNSGPAKARNLGLQNAQGEYLWFVDADDRCTLNSCEKLRDIIKIHSPDIIAFASQVRDFSSNKIIQDNTRSLLLISDEHIDKNINILKCKDLLLHVPTEAWNKLFSRKFLSKNNLKFNETLWGMDDGYFCQESILKANSIYCTRQILYTYYISNPSSIVSKLIKPNFQNYTITLNYAEQTENLLQQLNIPLDISESIQIKNINRLTYYFYKCSGIIRVLYLFRLKKILKMFTRKYPDAFQNPVCSQHVNVLLNKSLLSCIFKQGHKVPFKIYKSKQTSYHDFYKIQKTTIYFYKYKLISYKKQKFAPNLFQESLLTKIRRSINIALLHNQIFSQYKNLHTEKKVALIGAGPSLNFFTPLSNTIYVGCSRAFLYKKIKFNYLFAIDKIGISNFYTEFIQYNCTKFVGDINCGEDFQIPQHIVQKSGAFPYKTTNGITRADFTIDIDREPLGSFHSVAFQAIQFICFTHPKTIYLVGIDCGNKGQHFAGLEHDVGQRNENITYLEQEQKKEWTLFKKFKELYYPDIEIISVNPVGLTGLFRDVYTKEYLKEHPEINAKEVEILEDL